MLIGYKNKRHGKIPNSGKFSMNQDKTDAWIRDGEVNPGRHLPFRQPINRTVPFFGVENVIPIPYP